MNQTAAKPPPSPMRVPANTNNIKVTHQQQQQQQQQQPLVNHQVTQEIRSQSPRRRSRSSPPTKTSAATSPSLPPLNTRSFIPNGGSVQDSVAVMTHVPSTPGFYPTSFTPDAGQIPVGYAGQQGWVYTGPYGAQVPYDGRMVIIYILLSRVKNIYNKI